MLSQSEFPRCTTTEALLVAELLRREQQTGIMEDIDPIAAYCPQEPHEKQRVFLACMDEEVLFGGAAGPGKSSGILFGATQYVHVPGYAALILRKSFRDLALPGAIMDRAKSWWCGRESEGIRWNAVEKTFIFPSGATITFGYLENSNDHFRYQSSEFQYIGIDELTQFQEYQYQYMRSRLRRPKTLHVPLRLRAGSNPGGIGHDWVFNWFVNPLTAQATFISARMEDNPYLDQEAYRETLSKLDPITRAQLERGEWIRDSAGQMYMYDPSRNTWLADEHTPIPDYYVLGIDLGASERAPSTAFAVLGFYKHHPELIVMESYKLAGLTPTTIAEEIRRIRSKYRIDKIVADAGALGKGYVEEFRTRWALPVDYAQKTNRLAYVKLLNGDLANGVVKVNDIECAPLIEEWQSIQWNEKGTDSEEGSADHCADAVLYAWREGRHWLAKEEVKKPEPGTEEWQRARRDQDFARALSRAKKAQTPFYLR